jgi:hypothetical protein
MQRPALATLACVTTDCHLLPRAGAGTLGIRTVSGHADRRVLRCRTCGAACAERRGTALGQTKRPEATAEAGSRHLGAGWSGRAPARLGQVAPEAVARLGRVAGRQAARGHAQPGRRVLSGAGPRGGRWAGDKTVVREAARAGRRAGHLGPSPSATRAGLLGLAAEHSAWHRTPSGEQARTAPAAGPAAPRLCPSPAGAPLEEWARGRAVPLVSGA